MSRTLILALITMTAGSALAQWECHAICHYYLPNSSHTHPSLPDQAHDTLVESVGESYGSAHLRLENQCAVLGFEPHLVRLPDQQPMCWES